MFRMWGKIMKDNHLVKDMVACCGDYSISRTQMVFNCLDEICYKFDLEKPMWLDATVQDFKYHDKARFTQDNFIETVDFDYLEIQVIEDKNTPAAAIFQAVTGVSYYCDIRMRLRRIHRFLRLTDSLQSQQHALR